MFILRFLLYLSLALYSTAQTATIVDPAGNSVVVVTTTDAAGAPLTQTLQTLPPAGQAPPATPPPGAPVATPTTATTTTPTTTQAPAPPPVQGPVGQPAPTPDGAGGPTPYTYTTVINGVTTAVADNFTPSFPASIPVTPTGTGTVWNYSQYLSQFGGALATGGGRSAGYQNHASHGLTMMTLLLTIFML